MLLIIILDDDFVYVIFFLLFILQVMIFWSEKLVGIRRKVKRNNMKLSGSRSHKNK